MTNVLPNQKLIHVHAWEYVNVAMAHPRREIDAGGGGFEFYFDGLKASEAFKAGAAGGLETSPANVADFLFVVPVPKHSTTRQITDLIDRELINRCATAKIRRVGENVLTYWRRNKFKMGSAARAAKG